MTLGLVHVSNRSFLFVPMIITTLVLADYSKAIGLINKVFGPGRFAKTSEIWRQYMHWRPELSQMVQLGNECQGVVMIYRPNHDLKLAFLGPIAVHKQSRSQGIGHELVKKAMLACSEAGYERLFLIGSLEFFEPLGFRIDKELATFLKAKGPSFDGARLLSCKL